MVSPASMNHQAQIAPTLDVANGYTMPLPGLGKTKPLLALNPKYVYAQVRDVLKQEYGDRSVKVGNLAVQKDGRWYGVCQIRGEAHMWTVSDLPPLFPLLEEH